ncbi:DEAD/DEAH box helicase [bacterium]|nr:DEAD/DEAH box helicase [bacterium]MDB4538614.1 DEAD/DEAH box helicase [bacterium]
MVSNLWRDWAQGDLQGELESLSPGLLDQVEPLIPILSVDEKRPPSLGSKSTLISLLEAFLSDRAFRDKDFRRRCLNRIPEERLSRLERAFEISDAAGSFDERVERIVGLNWTQQRAQAFVDLFGLPSHFIPPPPRTIPSSAELEPASPSTPVRLEQPFKQLKDFQFRVYLEAVDLLQNPFERFVIQMPTGSGKTRTAMEVVSDHLNRTEGPDGAPLVIWLADSRELCEQAAQCFLEVWNHLGGKPASFFRAWGDHPLPDLTQRASVVVSTFKKLDEALKRNAEQIELLQSRSTLIVLDEAHRMMAPTYAGVVGRLMGNGTRVVGLSATPGRTDRDESRRLAEFFNEKRIELEFEADRSPIRVLKERGVLSHAKYSEIRTPLRIEASDSDRRAIAAEFSIPAHILKQLGSSQVRNIEILKRLISLCSDGRHVLFFACSVEHSRLIAALLKFAGISAAHLDGGTSAGRRGQIVEEFRDRSIQVLCNFGVLHTGFDAPNTDVVFISRPTVSSVLYSQMIGRGLRGPAMGGSPSCEVVDVRDNLVGFGDLDELYDSFDQYFDSEDSAS